MNKEAVQLQLFTYPFTFADIPQGAGIIQKPITFTGVRVEFPLDKIRLMATPVRKDRGEFSTVQAQSFLTLYKEEFEERLNAAALEFIKEKLG
jgi:hypothetical protein